MTLKQAISLVLLACPPANVAMPAQATTLEEAVAAAMDHAPEIEAARADADAADARIREARGQGLPSATLSGMIGYGRLDPQGFFGLPAANVTPRAAQPPSSSPSIRVAGSAPGSRRREPAAKRHAPVKP